MSELWHFIRMIAPDATCNNLVVTFTSTGVLLVQVICGTDLGEVGSKPDVYCTLEADCNGVMCKKTKSKIAKASINPIWDEVE